MTIAELCKKEGVTECFDKKHRNGFYAIQKPELVQETKILVAQHVPSDTWTEGSKAVRKLLDLPEGRIKISTKDIKEGYRLFVQSTSWNRKISPGVHIMLEVTAEQAKKYGVPGSVQNADEKQTVGTKKGAKKRVFDDDAGDDTTLQETPAQRRKRAKTGSGSC